jgi:tetratricopeptide (TPR) repeat protein
MRISTLIRAIGNVLVCANLVLVAGQFAFCGTAEARGRRLGVGQRVPEFSAVNAAGQTFDHKHGSGKVSMVVFLSGGQKRSAQAAADIEEIVSRLDANTKALDVVVVLYDPNGGACFPSKEGRPAKDFDILLDRDYKLWGKFGVIVTPTVVIGGTDDKVVWVEAGYGYDFYRSVQLHLHSALGLIDERQAEESTRVQTLVNDPVKAKMRRHLQTSNILEQKGRLESAIHEARRAQQLDPNCIEVILRLGQLYCKVGQSKKALAAAGDIKAQSRMEEAGANLILGWANRQLGKLEAAEELLLEAVRLNPKSSRALFELGKVYQFRGQTEKAMQLYYKALAQTFSEPVGADLSRPQQR